MKKIISKLITFLGIIIILLVYLDASKYAFFGEGSPIYGENKGIYLNDVSNQIWYIKIKNYIKYDVTLHVFFNYNQELIFKPSFDTSEFVLNDERKGNRWRIYNNNIYLYFEDENILLSGEITDDGKIINGKWEEQETPYTTYWTRFFLKKGSWEGFKLL
jgi:hypothetical protein